VSLKALSNLKDLKQLREFHFSFWDSKDVNNEKNKATELFYSWCGQNLPRLKLIGSTFEDCLCASDDWYSHTSHRMSPQFSGVSDLETLQAEGKLPEASLPKLKKLIYYGTKMEMADNLMSTLSSYQNLTHLGLKQFKWPHLVLILERVGQRLSHLFYEFDRYPENFDHYQIFHLCPNLVYYNQSVGHNASLESPFKSSVSSHNFRNLQECTIADVPADLFRMICQAPSIKSIWCFRLYVSKEHCLAVESVEAFHCLQTFQFATLIKLGDSCTMEDLERMIKKVVCSAPKLETILVDLTNCEEQWEKSGAIKFMQLNRDPRLIKQGFQLLLNSSDSIFCN